MDSKDLVELFNQGGRGQRVQLLYLNVIGVEVVYNQIIGTLSSQDEFVDDDERRQVRSGSRTSSKAGKTNV